MKRPTNSPWGRVHEADELIPGIWEVSTSGHGGLKLSTLRNSAVPEYMRHLNCWYEEDVEWSIVALVHPASFPDNQKSAKDTLRNWKPDYYAKFYGVDITTLEGKSYIYDECLFFQEHTHDWIGVCAYGDWHEHVPTGMVGVVAKQAGLANRGFLVTKEEYDKRGKMSFVVDLKKHKVWDFVGNETKRIR